MTAEDTPTRLLEAASIVFAERGYDHATVREICERAGANLASVNYHFGDKKRLYCEAIKRAHQLKRAHSPMPEWDADTPPEEKLRSYVRQMLACMLADQSMPHHRQLILQEIARPCEATSELVRECIASEFAVLLDVIGELIDAPLERKQMICFSIVGQCLYYKIAMPVVERLVEDTTGYSVERLAEHIAQLTLASLGRGPALDVVGISEAERCPTK